VELRFNNGGEQLQLCNDIERFQTKTAEGALFFVAAAPSVLLSVFEDDSATHRLVQLYHFAEAIAGQAFFNRHSVPSDP
jgi:hypothetical protein